MSTTVTEEFDRYQLLLRVIDDADVHSVCGEHPKIEKRVRRDHQKYFRAWLRDYEREVWALNRTRIQTLAADGRWLESWQAVRRGAEYARLCARLRWAQSLWRLGIASPSRIVNPCVAELRRLDTYAELFRRSITPFPSA
jgi:hypothetical protein